MPRLRQVPRAEAPPDVQTVYDMLFGGRDPVAEPGTATGTPGDWWTVFALVPDCFRHAVAGFAFYRGKDRKLDPKLRELGQTRAGFLRESQFVFSQHCKASRRFGVTDEQIAAIPNWQVSEVFDAKERAILAWADALILQGGRASDDLFEALHSHLSDEDILELTYHIMGYNLHAVCCKALRLEFDDVPERIREVPVPGEGETADWAGGAWQKT